MKRGTFCKLMSKDSNSFSEIAKDPAVTTNTSLYLLPIRLFVGSFALPVPSNRVFVTMLPTVFPGNAVS